jgi:hypothetical protein
MGRTLRYKIIVRKGVIDAILYNTGTEISPVYFVEHRYKAGDLVRLQDGGLATILVCPTGMLGRDW